MLYSLLKDKSGTLLDQISNLGKQGKVGFQMYVYTNIQLPCPLSVMKSNDDIGMTIMPTIRSAIARLMINMLETVWRRFSVLPIHINIDQPVRPIGNKENFGFISEFETEMKIRRIDFDKNNLPNCMKNHSISHCCQTAEQQQSKAKYQSVGLFR